MAVPSLITLKKGEMISLREITLPNIETFLQALPYDDTELVFIPSATYTMDNGYEIITKYDQSFGLFGKVTFESDDTTTATFNSIKEYGSSFPCLALKEAKKIYFNVTSNTQIDSIYFDIVDAETRTISYTKTTGEYTPLYFQVTNTNWEYGKNHTKSVIPLGIGDKAIVPNNTSYTWSPNLSEDCIVLELYNGLKHTQLEVISSVSQVSTKVVKLADWATHQVVRLDIINDLTKPIPGDKFTLTIRDIEDKTIYSVINFTYETESVPLVVHKAIEEFTDNTTYGSGTASILADKTLQFAFPTGAITDNNDLSTWIGYLENITDATLDNIHNPAVFDQETYTCFNRDTVSGTITVPDYVTISTELHPKIGTLTLTHIDGTTPIYLINSTGGKYNSTNGFFQSSIGAIPETGTLFNKPIFKYKPVISIPNTESQGMILSQPVCSLKAHGEEPFIKAGKNIINLVTKANMSVGSLNTINDKLGPVDLFSDTIYTIILDKEYPGFNMDTSTFQDEGPKQGMNLLTATWDNQQSDIVDLVPYIDEKNRFCCKVIPTTMENRDALVGVQLHNSTHWDNGKYLNDTFRFDIQAGTTSNVPLEVVETELTLPVGEKYTFTVYAPKNAALTAKSTTRNATVDISTKSITAKQVGTSKITITASMAGYNDISAVINVTVKAAVSEPKLELNRKTIVLAEGSSTQVKFSAEMVDSLTFRHLPDQYTEVDSDYTTKEGYTNGTINIKGLSQGVEELTVVGIYKNNEVIVEDIEVHVIPKGTYQIIPQSSKIKVDLKKNINGLAFWATTNAGFLRWEMKDDESLYSVTGNPGTDYTDINILINPLVKGNTTIKLYGHDDTMTTRLVELDIPVKITKNVEPGKNEIWVSAEHKQTGVDDDNIDFLDRRVFTVMKWLDRPTKDDIYGHTVYLPQRSGTLLTYEQMLDSTAAQKRYFDLAGKGYPTRKLNPKAKGYIYLDTVTGEIWKCIDNATDENHWFSMTGKQIGKPGQLIYPKPGAKGYGVGPMSYDLHESYGLTPLAGTYDPWSDEYGNYKDKYGNVYVNIPKHYIKATGSVIDVDVIPLDEEDNNN